MPTGFPKTRRAPEPEYDPWFAKGVAFGAAHPQVVLGIAFLSTGVVWVPLTILVQAMFG